MRWLVLSAVLVVSSSSAVAVTFDWVTVGDPGNPPDQLYPHENNPDDLRFGSVDYTYRISKFELTNDQYVEFLNAVDASGTNPNDVYNNNMGSDVRGGIALDGEAPNGSKYSTKTHMGNKPAGYVSFFDAMRFVNWLENGQPTDGSGTESGVYSISDGVHETRAPGATYFISSEDEWYKAAYYDPRSFAEGGPPGDDNYWLYPTASDSPPISATANSVGDISNPGVNVANYNRGGVWNGATNGNITTVGTAGVGSTSFYGTFDQGGNAWEWNEGTGFEVARSFRGGSCWLYRGGLNADGRTGDYPTRQDFNISFRVASIAEPLLLGDVNGDGEVNGLDVDPFVTVLLNGPPQPEADMNEDGVVNGLDVDSFVAAVVGGGAAAVPEPSSLLLCLLALTLVGGWRKWRG